MPDLTHLPPEFVELERFAEYWAVPTHIARHERRLDSSPEQRLDFYRAAAPGMERVFDYLDVFDLHALPEKAGRLLQLMLSLAEVSLTQEVYDPAYEAKHAKIARVAQITRQLDDI